MTNRTRRATLAFSSLGHLYVHLFTAFYFVIVLALERDWQRPYHELIELWTLGSLMVGAAALPAGWLADRWSPTGMMVVFFLGMGATSIAAGLVSTEHALLVALTGIGTFAAIYHPVGIPWLMRHAGNARGKAIGFNGIFGSLGTAAAALLAGALIDVSGWRAAFIVPGAASMLTGFALLAAVRRGLVTDAPPAAAAQSRHDHAEGRMRAVCILLVTLFVGGIIYQSTQTALPKLFTERVTGLIGEGTLGVGVVVAGVYSVAAFMQLAGGHLADRFPLKPVYVGTILFQVPLLWLAAWLAGPLLLPVTVLMVMGAASALPAENMLLARYTPESRHGMVFGVKFVLAFCAAPLSVQFVARVTGATGGFFWVFASLAALGTGALLAALMLPAGRDLALARAAATR